MAGDILVASLGVVAAILCFFFWYLGTYNTDNGTRYPMQIIIFAFLLGVIVLIGKAGLDYKHNCNWLVDNSTTSGSTTSYSYSYQCSTNTQNTANIFYDITVWIARITAAYLFLNFAFELITYFGLVKRGQK